MKRETGTIVKVYLLDQSAPDKQEGFVLLWKHKGKLQKAKNVPFNYLAEIPNRIKQLLSQANIQWPVSNSK